MRDMPGHAGRSEINLARSHPCHSASRCSTMESQGAVCYNCLGRMKGGNAVAIENGEWIMRGSTWDDPNRIRTWEARLYRFAEAGFLPLFKMRQRASPRRNIPPTSICGQGTRHRTPGSGVSFVLGVAV